MTAVGQVFRTLDRELWVVTAAADGRRGGLIATSVTQASIAPEMPRVCVGLAKQHHTWELVEAAGAFAMHLLRPSQLEWVWWFGTTSGRLGDKFAELNCSASALGNPVLLDSLGWLDCRVEDRLDAGDRTIYLAEVVDGGLNGAERPLTSAQAFSQSTPEQLRELRTQLERDAAVDVGAIAAWRRSKAAEAKL